MREEKLLLTDGILAEQLLHYICCYLVVQKIASENGAR